MVTASYQPVSVTVCGPHKLPVTLNNFTFLRKRKPQPRFLSLASTFSTWQWPLGQWSPDKRWHGQKWDTCFWCLASHVRHTVHPFFFHRLKPNTVTFFLFISTIKLVWLFLKHSLQAIMTDSNLKHDSPPVKGFWILAKHVGCKKKTRLATLRFQSRQVRLLSVITLFSQATNPALSGWSCGGGDTWGQWGDRAFHTAQEWTLVRKWRVLVPPPTPNYLGLGFTHGGASLFSFLYHIHLCPGFSF